MRFLRIAAENYKGVKHLEVMLKELTFIIGPNRAGKTTVVDIPYDILIGTMSDGTSTDNIRPKDDFGNDANNDDIIREIDIEFDGTVSTVRKITRKKFVKDRQTGEIVFKGNEDSYEIDGFPYKKAEFKKWLEERMAAEDWNFCLNPQIYINKTQKSTVEGRKILQKSSGFDSSKFVSDYPEFKDIADALKGHSVDELKKVLNSRLKKAASEIQLATDSIKLIGELEDVRAEENPERKELEVELARFVKAQDDKTKKLSTLPKNEEDIPSLRQKQNSILAKANEELIALKAEKKQIASNVGIKMNETKADLHTMVKEFNTVRESIGIDTERLAELRKAYETVSTAIYPEGKDVCPSCGQKLPADKIEEAKEAFARQKKADMTNLSDQIDKVTKDIESKKNALKEIQMAYQSKKEMYQSFSDALTDVLAEIEKMPDLKTVDDVPEAKIVEEQIQKVLDIEQKREVLNNDLRHLADAIANTERRIREIDFGIELKKREAEADRKRLSDQQSSLKRAQDEYGKVMSQLDRLKEYSLMLNKYLEDYVNQFFTHFKFSLFDETQDGSVIETCRMVVNGIPYGNGLNHGDMILCEIDLAKGFQKMLGVNLPIFVDDSESLDEDRIPKLDNQLIIIRRTDDKGLVVTYGSD